MIYLKTYNENFENPDNDVIEEARGLIQGITDEIPEDIEIWYLSKMDIFWSRFSR